MGDRLKKREEKGQEREEGEEWYKIRNVMHMCFSMMR